MARGKQTCKILKEIRRQIAKANGIEFVTSECRYKGDCLGTCPKCEAEVRYLEQQLRARSLAGKAVTLAGISAGMIIMTGCSGTSSNQSSETLQGGPTVPVEQTDTIDSIATPERPEVNDTASVSFPYIKMGEVPEETIIVDAGGIEAEDTSTLRKDVSKDSMRITDSLSNFRTARRNLNNSDSDSSLLKL